YADNYQYIPEPDENNNYMVKTIVYGSGSNETTKTESVSLHNLSIVNENLIAKYSKNFITCVHLLASNSQIIHVQNYYCTEGNNIVVSQLLSNFNVTVGQSYKLCHGNNYNICSALMALANHTVATETTQTNITNPDLVVSDMTFNPANPTTSDLIKINVTVKNIGSTTAGTSILQVNYDPGMVYTRLSISSLAAGASYSSLLSWYLPANSYTFTAVADKDSQVSEQNENNNLLVKSLTVTSLSIINTTTTTNQTNLSVTVLTPNGNENWHVGNAYNIQWISQNLPSGNNIGIQLMRGLAIEQILFAQLPNNQNSATWTVPYNIPYNVVPSLYKIRVTYIPSSGAIEAEDSSDATFNIVYP
ncbi:MAG: CARDB domain-containing protein, partial [Nanoarchaeota archaeon]